MPELVAHWLLEPVTLGERDVVPDAVDDDIWENDGEGEAVCAAGVALPIPVEESVGAVELEIVNESLLKLDGVALSEGNPDDDALSDANADDAPLFDTETHVVLLVDDDGDRLGEPDTVGDVRGERDIEPLREAEPETLCVPEPDLDGAGDVDGGTLNVTAFGEPDPVTEADTV